MWLPGTNGVASKELGGSPLVLPNLGALPIAGLRSWDVGSSRMKGRGGRQRLEIVSSMEIALWFFEKSDKSNEE